MAASFTEGSVRKNSDQSNSFINKFKNVHWFELDFKEVFDYKLPKIQPDSDEFNCGFIHTVACDLSLSTWPQHLKDHGFQSELKTLWLLEGLLGYLTEDEVTTIFQTVTNLSAQQSKLIATFIGNDFKMTSNLHRSRCDEPMKLLSPYGWTGIQYSFFELAIAYERPLKSNYNAYFLVHAELSH